MGKILRALISIATVRNCPQMQVTQAQSICCGCFDPSRIAVHADLFPSAHEDGGGPCMTILHLILISGVYITPVCIRILVGRPMHYAQGNVEEYCIVMGCADTAFGSEA